MPKMTRDTAALVRAVLEVAAATVPPSNAHGAAGVELDNLTAEALGVDPILGRAWKRKAGWHELDQLEALEALEAQEAAEADEADEDPAP